MTWVNLKPSSTLLRRTVDLFWVAGFCVRVGVVVAEPAELTTGSVEDGAGSQELPVNNAESSSRSAQVTQAEISGSTRDDVSQADWQEEYRQLNERIQRYDEDVTLFRKDVQTIIDQKYKEELERIQQTYDSRYERLDDEQRIRREQAVAAFERFIQKYPGSEHTPLAMFRLAELYYDQSSYAFILAQKNYDQVLKGLDLSDTKSLPEDPRYDFSKSLGLYDRIVKEFPEFKHIDAVFYMRGYLLGNDLALQYDPETAKAAWMELISKRPDSTYASQAYLRIGEYYFEKGTDTDLHTAIDYYQRVMSYQDKWYDRALYKVAWANYKLSDYDNAIARFIDLIDFSQAQLAETGAESDLRTEGVEYLAISFADDGDVNKVLTFFDKIGDRPYKFEVLKKLADIYYKQANFTEAIETYTRLQQLFPESEENPAFQAQIVAIYEKMPLPDVDAALKAKEFLVKNYSPDSEWARKQGLNRAAVTKAQELAQNMLQGLAFYYNNLAHGATEEAERQRYYGIAADKYREYLTRFPYSKNAYELQFFFAECLLFSQRFEEAAVEYEKAMTSTDPKYHADAARGRIDAYHELVRRTEGEEGVTKSFVSAARKEAVGEAAPESAANVAEVPQPLALSDLKEKYVQAIDVLARVAPENQDIPNFLFIAAQIYYYHHQYDRSQIRYQELIDQYPTSAVAVVAAANLVDGLIKQQKWVEVQKAVERVVLLTLGSDPGEWARVRSQLVDAQAQAKRKEAEIFVVDGNYLRAHEIFKKAGTDSDLLNAAKIMDGQGMVDTAIEDYLQLVRQYPKSDHVPFALFRLASNYEKFFDLPKAIEYYERLASSYPRYERAPDSINNAALLRIGLHQYREAARAYERYSLAYQSQPDAEFLLFLAGKYYLKAEDYTEAVRAFRDYLRRYGRENGDHHMEAYLSIVNGLEKLGRAKEALEMEKKGPAVLASLKELASFSPLGLNMYAQLMFKDMQRLMDTFREIRLTGSVKALEASLDRKNQLKDQLETKMKEMIRIGDLEWSTAALYTVGLAYHSYAEALREAVPPELNDEDKEIYLRMLEDQFIFPFEDRALEYYKRNLEIESKQKVWNRWIEQTYMQLNRLRPDLYPARKKEQVLFDPGEQHFMAPPVQSVAAEKAGAVGGANN